jgi:hypothetical protein
MSKPTPVVQIHAEVQPHRILRIKVKHDDAPTAPFNVAGDIRGQGGLPDTALGRGKTD